MQEAVFDGDTKVGRNISRRKRLGALLNFYCEEAVGRCRMEKPSHNLTGATRSKLAADFTAITGKKRHFVARLDLLDQRSIARFAAAWCRPEHVLVNNAGIMACP
jgi:NAD(P)-dependent dehydrogenase (short-subunit alcohol dehydrogenase family)